jgi:hypothetical protein
MALANEGRHGAVLRELDDSSWLIICARVVNKRLTNVSPHSSAIVSAERGGKSSICPQYGENAREYNENAWGNGARRESAHSLIKIDVARNARAYQHAPPV